MIKHACEYCGLVKLYKSPSLVKRFCSHKCSNKWKWENVRKPAEVIILTCPNCNKKFSMPVSEYNVRKKHEENIYCSRECYLSKIRICNKICIGCGVSFFPKNNRVRFCSKKCYQNYAKTNKTRKKTGFWLENGYKVLYNDGHPIKEHVFIMEQNIHRKLNRG